MTRGGTTDRDSTLADVQPAQLRHRARWGRRFILALAGVLVLAGATSLLGVRTASASASAGAWSMTVRYPQIARAGMDVQWQVKVTHAGGFSGPIRLAVDASYFDIFETQGFHPEPSTETRDRSLLRLEFDPPPGDVFVVDFDAYIQPSSQLGRRSHVFLLDGDQPRLSVGYRTWLWP